MYFKFNLEKLKSVVSFVIKEFKITDRNLILKIISAADIIHLNNYGRPVCNTEFKESNVGTIGSEAFNYLQQTGNLGNQGSEDYLSKSDKRVLSEVAGKNLKIEETIELGKLIPIDSIISSKQVLEYLKEHEGLLIVL